MANKPAAESALHGLFDEELPAEAQVAEAPMAPMAAVAPYAPPVQVLDSASPWPKFIPDVERTLQILRGAVEPPAALKPQVDQVLSTLSDELRGALADPALPLPPQYALLARAAAIRWRVNAALSTRAASKASDAGSVEQLFNELDGILAELREAAVAPEAEELHGDLEAERIALAKAAVDLAEAVQVSSQASAQQAVASTSQKYRAVPGVRMISSAKIAEPEGMSSKQKMLYGFFGLVVVAGLAFHGIRMFGGTVSDDGPVPLPTGTTASHAPPSTARMVSSKDGKPLDSLVVDQLKREAAKAGGTAVLISPETMMILPPGMNPPQMKPQGEVKP